MVVAGGGADPVADVLGGSAMLGGGAIATLGTINAGARVVVKGFAGLISAAFGNSQPLRSAVVQGVQSAVEDKLGLAPGVPRPLGPITEGLKGTNPCP